jgi:protein-L-isoaspartate(D-aspartate) O-methyltransferase
MGLKSEKEALIGGLTACGYLRSKRVIAAFKTVPRERFLPENYKRWAYADTPLPIGGGQTISAPHMVAVMTEALDVRSKHRIMEIGAGSGYQAAILATLVQQGEIHTLEIVDELIDHARRCLKPYKNVFLHHSDASHGLKSKAPFDRILATCGCPDIPKAWVDQLKDSGSIIAPVGGHFEQRLVRITKCDGKITRADLSFPCVFVPMRGEHGWD